MNTCSWKGVFCQNHPSVLFSNWKPNITWRDLFSAALWEQLSQCLWVEGEPGMWTWTPAVPWPLNTGPYSSLLFSSPLHSNYPNVSITSAQEFLSVPRVNLSFLTFGNISPGAIFGRERRLCRSQVLISYRQLAWPEDISKGHVTHVQLGIQLFIFTSVFPLLCICNKHIMMTHFVPIYDVDKLICKLMCFWQI